MKKTMRRLCCGIIFAVLRVPVAQAATEQPIIHGAMIRQAKVEGHSLHYHLVGFQITAPDGSVQSTLTMAMQGGYGADVVLPAKGSYRVETKIDLGTAIQNDGFSLDLK